MFGRDTAGQKVLPWPTGCRDPEVRTGWCQKSGVVKLFEALYHSGEGYGEWLKYFETWDDQRDIKDGKNDRPKKYKRLCLPGRIKYVDNMLIIYLLAYLTRSSSLILSSLWRYNNYAVLHTCYSLSFISKVDFVCFFIYPYRLSGTTIPTAKYV